MPQCIWTCGNEANTDEDVVPQWAREHMGAKQGRKRWEVRDLTPEGLPTPVGNLRPGPLDGWYVKARKAACGQPGCNDGWMSALQTAAKPVLLPMMDDDECPLDTASLHTIRVWAAMTGITMHYAHQGPGNVVDVSRRSHLYKQDTPAPYTCVFLANVEHDDMPAVLHTSYARRLNETWPMLYAGLLTLDALGFVILQGPMLPWQKRVLRSAAGHLIEVPELPILGRVVPWPKPKVSVEQLLRLFEELMPEAQSLPEPSEDDDFYVATRSAPAQQEQDRGASSDGDVSTSSPEP